MRSTLILALTTTTCFGRSRLRRPTAVVATSLANRPSRTRDSKVIARIHRASGMPPNSSLKPTAFASPRRVIPVMSGSVPRKRAHAACDDAATALDPPPMTLVATKRCPDSDYADDVLVEL